MSPNDDSENDIWNYKPLKKKKKQESSSVPKTVVKKICSSRETKGHTSSSVTSSISNINIAVKSEPVPLSSIEDNNTLNASVWNCNNKSDPEEEAAVVFCPLCQMPLSIQVRCNVEFQCPSSFSASAVDDVMHTCACASHGCRNKPRWRIKKCPDGLMCSSTFPNHYRDFNHTLLAQSRSNGSLVVPQITSMNTDQSGTAITAEINHSGLANNHVFQADNSTLKTSQDNLPIDSLPSSPFDNSQTKSPTIRNGLLLLRSPALQDLKKKKGWSSPKVPKSEKVSTPVRNKGDTQARGCILQSTASDVDYPISYSPLSELPAEVEAKQTGARKTLFDVDPGESKNDKSIAAFSDSDDILFAEFLDDFDEEEEKASRSLNNTQIASASASQQCNLEMPNKATDTRVKEKPGSSISVGSSKNSIHSAQSIVLERLRDTILDTERPLHQSGSKTNSEMSLSDKMTPQKIQNKAAQSGSLKQTDIAVFFGLKPLTVKETEESHVSLPGGEKQGVKTQKKSRQRPGQASTSAGSSQGAVATTVESEGGSKRAGRKGWRRWSNAGAEEGKYPGCPFYKKIPGTKFVVDAFRYGPINGISAYFLTHFHSDHYDGLRKTSTLPIYCNKITGNLVKHKLKVPEQYVNILPMNTEVTVEGVRVILMDANHCPGAAMLLFFLPDGQTVLHTGDFRADSSMETYPELERCRVQTLYLDTTYCSPEYTFPKQQEVINYAANTAFELVTLSPRTLVVCGSYSVGKEKVFLALADVLGSKVCLSRDKFNTMCCLESEDIKQRITTDWKSAQVHVLPMMQLSFQKLQDHLARFSAKYDRLVAFKPTGWTFSQTVESVEDIVPHVNGNISIYGIPYSEHSSFLELKRFVQWLKPLKIIPTVNTGRWESRKAMERCFGEWMKETSKENL